MSSDPADHIGSDRQLAMTAVDQHRQPNRQWAPVVEQGVEGRPDRAAGEEDIVDQIDDLVVDGVGQNRLLEHRLLVSRSPRTDVVTIERDVEPADRHLAASGLLEGARQAIGQRDAAGVDAHQHHGIAVALENLGGHPGDGSRHRRLIQDFR